MSFQKYFFIWFLFFYLVLYRKQNLNITLKYYAVLKKINLNGGEMHSVLLNFIASIVLIKINFLIIFLYGNANS